jgi:hypothetical protein
MQERAVQALDCVHWLDVTSAGNSDIQSLMQLRARVLEVVDGIETTVISEFERLLNRVDAAWSVLVGRPLLTENGGRITLSAEGVLTVGSLELDCFERLGLASQLTAPFRSRAIVWKSHSRQLEFACHVYQSMERSLNSIPTTIETEQLAEVRALIHRGLHEEKWGPHGGNLA